MNTEQSYANVAPGATAPEETELFNDGRTRVYLNSGLRFILEDPEQANRVRTCLRSWFMAYVESAEDSPNGISLGENCSNYEILDGYFSEVIDLHFGWLTKLPFKSKKADPVGSSQILSASQLFINQAKAILEIQDQLAVQVFGPQTLKLGDDESVIVAARTMRELKKVREMLDGLSTSL